MESLHKTSNAYDLAATDLGKALCDAAYWNEAGSECNWMGHRDIEDALTAPYSQRNAALSPELYGGSPGVALFLAELFGVTGEQRFRETAEAALKRSIRHIKEHSTPAYPLSLYAGHVGLLYAAIRSTTLGLEPSLAGDFAWLFDHAQSHWQSPHPYDVIGGNAGAILSLLHIGETYRPEESRELAVRLGDELCRAAKWSGDACCWETTEGFAKLPPMTGFSHGASGIALSLLRLYELTGETRFLDTARGGFSFEDAHYNPQEKNWVDTRYPYRRDEGLVVGRFRKRWCHGAPGIAIARALASRLDHGEAGRHEDLARAAGETTISALEACMEQADFDATLCHGIGGLSEILLVVGEILDEPGYRDRAQRTAGEMIRRHGASGAWPSGLGSKGPTPCLMVGTSGVGLHFLRLANPGQVLSPLLPGWRDAQRAEVSADPAYDRGDPEALPGRRWAPPLRLSPSRVPAARGVGAANPR